MIKVNTSTVKDDLIGFTKRKAYGNVQTLVKNFIIIIIVITETRATPYMESLPSIFIVVLAVSMTKILIHLNHMYVSRLSPKISLPFLVHCYLLLFPSIIVVITITDHIME